MYALLLAITYLAFISLGLPDSLLGSAWPVMQEALGAEVSFAGVITIVISACTIVSSLCSDRLTRRLGAGGVTALSVLMTAVALFGFSTCTAPWQLCLWAVPYGLGAGAVDAALNNYAALHFSARHMNWLHCFWGVGCSISPFIMSTALTGSAGWRGGYRWVSFLQIGLTVLLFLSLPLWKRPAGGQEASAADKPATMGEMLRIPGVPLILLAFFGYCALESTAGLWASTYLVNGRGVDAQTAARCASLFYLGITGGRFLSGLVADRLGDRRLIRVGLGVLAVGVLAILLPVPGNGLCLCGLVLTGLGCAPIYPSIIHATPANFGAEHSQGIVGVQMACAYTGSTLMPPVFGLMAGHGMVGLYPVYLLCFLALMVGMTEGLNRLKRESLR